MLVDSEYKNWISEIKSKIRAAQIKAALAVNAVVIEFYWDLGQMIVEKQTAWGTKFIEQLSKDLQAEFPDMKGLSTRNLKYCRSFCEFYNNTIGQQVVAQIQSTDNKEDVISQQLVAQLKQIPWGHNILIFTKSANIRTAAFYIEQTLANAWGRETLALPTIEEIEEEFKNLNATNDEY
jgi:predicted nuclease of restriction endonuclease-like (RecB) superfamily